MMCLIQYVILLIHSQGGSADRTKISMDLLSNISPQKRPLSMVIDNEVAMTPERQNNRLGKRLGFRILNESFRF